MGVKRCGASVRAGLIVVFIGHLLSLLVVAAVAHHAGNPFPHGAPLWWAVGGGFLAALSLMAFYLALSAGHMGAAAAISGLLCAAVPALVSALTEGAPGWKRLLGFALAAIAIWRIASPGPAEANSDPLLEASELGALHESSAEAAATHRRSSLFAVLGGIGFGIYFVSLKYAAPAGVLWALGAARIGSAGTAAVTLLALMLFARRDASLTFSKNALAWIVSGAAMDTAGNLLYIAATQLGRLDVAAVIASLYPASTIVLAAIILRERTTRRQLAGMFLALPAVILITL
jgi:drug/metabolite transporter (DMT)-like permease